MLSLPSIGPLSIGSPSTGISSIGHGGFHRKLRRAILRGLLNSLHGGMQRGLHGGLVGGLLLVVSLGALPCEAQADDPQDSGLVVALAQQEATQEPPAQEKAPGDATPPRDEASPPDTASELPEPDVSQFGPIVAYVDDEPIYANEVNTSLKLALRGRKVLAAEVPKLQAMQLVTAVKQRIIERYLATQELGITPEQIDAQIKTIRQQIKKQDSTLEIFLQQRGLTLPRFRDRALWLIGWPKYLQQQITEEQINEYFDSRRKEFDGSEIRASHILLPVVNSAQQGAQDKAVAKAEAIRQQILDGELTFEEAAQKHSIGPSRREGGDLGFFPRTGRMVEPFAAAAFALKQGEISPPVITPFGVHLIRCEEIRSGEKKAQESRQQIQAALIQKLFNELAISEGEKVTIRYTGVMPYLNPVTNELVIPKTPPRETRPQEDPPEE
jgi:parvulin-like peptidyl-prolyl isomerase